MNVMFVEYESLEYVISPYAFLLGTLDDEYGTGDPFRLLTLQSINQREFQTNSQSLIIQWLLNLHSSQNLTLTDFYFLPSLKRGQSLDIPAFFIFKYPIRKKTDM